MSIHSRSGLHTPAPSKRFLAEQVQFALTWLKRHSTRATLEGMVRYSIPSDHAYGVPMKDIKALGKTLGRNQFEKRTVFALLWSLTVHDKAAGDKRFEQGLALIEREAGDERNFVKKATNMALRAIGKRNRALNSAATIVARRLANSKDATARWVVGREGRAAGTHESSRNHAAQSLMSA